MPSRKEHSRAWIARFHLGDRDVIEQCYREHLAMVMNAVGKVLYGADQETVVHDVFCKLLDSAETRASYQGGDFTAWLRTLARNKAIDYVRRHGRETTVEPDSAARLADVRFERCDHLLELAVLLERFVNLHISERLQPLFKARFLEQRSQQETADAIGMPRTTVAYHELRMRKKLRRFALRSAFLHD